MRLLKSIDATKNKAVAGEVYKIDGVVKTITSVSNRYVCLDGIPYHAKMFHSLARQVKTMQSKIVQRVVTEVEKPPLYSDLPHPPLRYILLKFNDNEELKFLFAQKHTSHYDLGQEFRKSSVRNFRVVGGGFYASLAGNANEKHDDGDKYSISNDNFSTIILFGKSDTYGLGKDFLDKALELNPNIKLVNDIV